MRDIKFRAWDKERKVMMPVKLMDFSQWWVSCDPTYGQAKPLEYGERNSFKNESTDRHVLMQYIGLCDWKGKPIYEGDIAKGINRIHEDEIRQTVTFLNGCTMFGNWNAHEYFNRHQNIEVIGNIYEGESHVAGA